MRDGVELAAHVYLPAIAKHQAVPTVLTRLPYDKGGRYTFLDQIANHFTAHGFAVVVQDVRGKFESQGELLPFKNEPDDGYDTIEWVAQQEWSNESVGMYGDSYYGFTQWAAVSRRHPALKAIVPQVTSSDLFIYFGTKQMPRLPFFEWFAQTYAHPFLSFEPFSSRLPKPAYHPPAGYEAAMDTARALAAAVDDGSFVAELYPDGWPAETLSIPALHQSGWYDNCLEGQLREWQRVTDAPAAAHQFLRIYSTDHESFPWREAGVPLDNHETDDDAATTHLHEYMPEVISFLDHYLNDRGGRWSAPTVRFTTTNGHAHVSDQWPPAQVRPVSLTLSDFGSSLQDRGRLSGLTDDAAAPVDDSITWTHDPSTPVPFLPESEFGQCADLPDESYLHGRDDVAVFDSPPVGARVDLCGAVSFTATIDASSAGTHVVARLLDLYPSGEARVITYGAATADTSGGPATISVPMMATAYRIRPGHSLRLAVSSSCFPLYPVHPGHDGDVWNLEGATATRQTLSTNIEHPSKVDLHVL